MGSVGVVSVMEKTRDNRLKWFRHIMRRGNLETVRVAMEDSVETLSGKKGLRLCR